MFGMRELQARASEGLGGHAWQEQGQPLRSAMEGRDWGRQGRPQKAAGSQMEGFWLLFQLEAKPLQGPVQGTDLKRLTFGNGHSKRWAWNIAGDEDASRETSQKAPVTIQARDDGDLGGGSGMMIRGQILLNVVGRPDRMCWRTEHGIRHLSSGPPKKKRNQRTDIKKKKKKKKTTTVHDR